MIEVIERGVTLHCSWNGLIRSWFGAMIVITAAAAAVVVGGLSPVSIVLGVIGVGLGAVVLFDLPLATTFDSDGLVRRCPLRRHRMRWADIKLITRHADVLRSVRVVHPRPDNSLQRAPGGLVAVVGRRRYLLVNQPESSDEYEAMTRHADAAGTQVVAEPPSDYNPPTWLYRRRRWRPEVDLER